MLDHEPLKKLWQTENTWGLIELKSFGSNKFSSFMSTKFNLDYSEVFNTQKMKYVYYIMFIIFKTNILKLCLNLYRI